MAGVAVKKLRYNRLSLSNCPVLILFVLMYFHRALSASSKVVGMMTEGNPAYGLTSPCVKSTETKGDYEIPQYIQQPPVPAPEETVYEGVF